MTRIEKEENPFEDREVAEQWINSVENEEPHRIRAVDIYPRIKKFLKELKPGDFVVEIGSGQGICSKNLGRDDLIYTGVEPSKILTERALSLYGETERQKFIIGNAYDLPFAEGEVEAVFSVNVWFHLQNLNMASIELSRILKKDGLFYIVTANPDAYKEWESFYEDFEREGKKIVGKVNIPINPLSRNTFYQHSQREILDFLKDNDLEVLRIEDFGDREKFENKGLFISILGKKK